jgi:UDP-N-acetylmuramate dehydrogenase
MKTSLLIQKNVPLASLTTLKIGGPARFLVKAETEKDVCEAVKFAQNENLRLFVLGGGSNLLISDRGFDGLVLHISLKGIDFQQIDNTVSVTAQAGEDWDNFVKVCVEKNLAGAECLSGIPGTVGGTPVQNVGAYGQEVSETISRVKVLERETIRVYEMSNANCGFAYRTSIFNTICKEKFIVLAVTFSLQPNGAPKIVYQDLLNFFGNKLPSLAETRDAILKIRAAKSMVIDENDVNSKSAGSFFKNPIVTKEKYAEISQNFGAKILCYEVDDNHVKIPAAWLIEKSGFQKGFQMGPAGLSQNHTLALINRGNATAEDIIKLKDLIQNKVQESFGVMLMPEPVFVGF